MTEYPICAHCGIEIDPLYDTDHELPDGSIVCDSCHSEYRVYGEDFGDWFHGRCPHVRWALQDMVERNRKLRREVHTLREDVVRLAKERDDARRVLRDYEYQYNIC